MVGAKASTKLMLIPAISSKGTPTLLKIDDTEAGPTVNISPPLGVIGYSRFKTTISSPPASNAPFDDSNDVKLTSVASPPFAFTLRL